MKFSGIKSIDEILKLATTESQFVQMILDVIDSVNICKSKIDTLERARLTEEVAYIFHDMDNDTLQETALRISNTMSTLEKALSTLRGVYEGTVLPQQRINKFRKYEELV